MSYETHCSYILLLLCMFSWLVVRGPNPGPLFCEVKRTASGFRLDINQPLSSVNFVAFFRDRLSKIRFGQCSAVTLPTVKGR